MSDTTINSTPTLEVISTVNGVQQAMDTAQFTLYQPNLNIALGPVVPTTVSVGVYQYTLPLGTLKLPGTWVGVWYLQYGQQSAQVSKPFSVGAWE